MVALILIKNRYNVLSFSIFILFSGFAFADLFNINSIALYESSEYAYVDQGVIHVNPKTTLKIILFGTDLKSFSLSFSDVTKKKKENCDDDRFTQPVTISSKDGKSAIFSQSFDVSTNII